MQNWPAPWVREATKQYRVDRAHFRIHRDRLRACLGRLAQGHAATARAGEADGLDPPVADQGDPHFATRAEQQREHAFRQSAFFHGAANCAAYQFAGARVRAVGLDDDRATGSQGRGGIAAGNGEGQGEIAGAEHGHRTQRHLTLAQVRAGQRLTFR